jgi:high affinity Mn2+ porin
MQLLVALLLSPVPGVTRAADGPASEPAPWLVAGQLTGVGLFLPRLRSPYSDPALSFGPGPRAGWSTVATLYLGVRPWPGATAVVDGEWADGAGVPNVSGVSAYPDANIIRVAKVGVAPYVARAFLQQDVALGAGPADAPEPPSSPEDPFSPDGAWALRTPRPASRVTFTLGKVALPDFFDAAEVSSDPRHRFMNWAVMTNGAWDFAADTRGYTWAAVVALVTPRWGLRAGAAMMPTAPNGPSFDLDLREARSEVVEGEVRWTLAGRGGSARLLGFANHARAARYDDALAGAPAGGAPDLGAFRRRGAVKIGAALLVQQEVGPAATYVRGSWNDGGTETFAFTEIDRAASAGAVVPVPGPPGRPAELGVAVEVGGLSGPHARYLAAGGRGFQLGDGRLRDRAETVVEAYYLVRVAREVEVAADFQEIWNPGMNGDRGPASIVALRVHLHR